MPDFRTWFRGLTGGGVEPGARSAPSDPIATIDADDTEGPPAPAGHQELDAFATANNDFAFALYEKLRVEPGNAFFSPFSVRTALGMALAGAGGETATQMSEALRPPLSDGARDTEFAEMLKRLSSAGESLFELEIANSLWAQSGAPIQPEFAGLVARRYGAGARFVDFHGDAEGVRSAINEWIEEKTRKKIRDLIPQGGVDAMTRLVLANAVYFKGQWVAKFPVEATRHEPFYLGNGREVQAKLMHQETGVRYMQSGDYAAVDLDYRGCDLPMLVLLPNRKDGLVDLERQLSPHMLHDCVARMRFSQVELSLPRFRITWGTVDLGRELASLGMPFAFDDTMADFTGINGVEPAQPGSLYISAVFHKAFVEANETGTEAAAATAAPMMPTLAMGPVLPAPKPPVFRADHPFLFAIRDRLTGAIIFLGRVVDPTRDP